MAVNSNPVAPLVDGNSAPTQPSPSRLQQRALWLFCHRWIGVILGLPIAIIGITGSLILLIPMMLNLEHGEMLKQSAVTNSSYQAPSAWIASVRAANSSKFEIVAVTAPYKSPVASETALVIGHTHEGPEGEYHRVFSVDPNTAKLKGHYDIETTLAFVTTAIHTSLLIPIIGIDIVAILGVIALFSIASGVYLWWPKPARWKAAFTFKTSSRGMARWFNLHNVMGIYCALGLFVLSLTGVWMLRPEWIEPAVTLASPIRKAPPKSTISAQNSCAARTTAEQAIALATSTFPGRQVAYLVSPEDEEGRNFFEVNLASAGDWNDRDGDTTVFIDPVCARVAKVIDGQSLSGAEVAKRSTVPFHNGRAFGTIGEILTFIVGFSLPVFYLSGLILWWRRRKFRKSIL